MKPIQVEDDFELLKEMLSGLSSAPQEYRPTNYWEFYERRFVPELQRLGLRDFRSRRRSVLPSFGASDLPPRLTAIDLTERPILGNRRLMRLPFYSALLDAASRILTRLLTTPLDLYDTSLPGLQNHAFRYVELLAKSANAIPPSTIEASVVGNPGDSFLINGKPFTMSFLYYYLRYIFCASECDFNKVATVVELGSGAGKQAEVLHKLFPHICIYLFDIPPQLYVCEQFLKATFPGRVVSFRETRSWTSMPDPEPGKIFILPSWKFPLLKDARFDLFWNACSFQEMEPHVAENYIASIRNSAQMCFLQQLTHGMRVATETGTLGVRRPTTFDDYQKFLPGFQITKRADSERPLDRYPGYEDSFWKRRG